MQLSCMLVSYCCCDKLWQTWWLKTVGIYFPIEALWSSGRPEVWNWYCWAEVKVSAGLGSLLRLWAHAGSSFLVTAYILGWGMKLNSRNSGMPRDFHLLWKNLGASQIFWGKNDRIQYVFHKSLHDHLNKCYHWAGDLGSTSGLGRSLREGNGYPLQYSCLENSMDRGAWWATAHGVAKSQTWLSD